MKNTVLSFSCIAVVCNFEVLSGQTDISTSNTIKYQVCVELLFWPA